MDSSKKKTGFESVLEMFRVMDAPDRDRLLKAVTEKNPELGRALSEGIFRFEDLLGLEPAALQRLLREAPRSVLALSLRGMAEEFQKNIFASIPGRAGEEIREEWATLGPRRLPDVLEARRKIIEFGKQIGLIRG